MWTAFPDCPPYDGEHADVIPHLTVAQDAPLDDLREAEDAVLTELPIRMHVRSVQVMVGTDAPRSWRTIAELPLGATRESDNR